MVIVEVKCTDDCLMQFVQGCGFGYLNMPVATRTGGYADYIASHRLLLSQANGHIGGDAQNVILKCQIPGMDNIAFTDSAFIFLSEPQ